MGVAERLYKLLLCLYPAQHRQLYGECMLQHARDLSRDARENGRWPVVLLCLRLLKDGLANAAIEHLEVIKMANNRFSPVPWSSVLLASFPGVLMGLTRPYGFLRASWPQILGYAYLLALVVGLALSWRRRGGFPVWALLPAGMLALGVSLTVRQELANLLNSLRLFGARWIPIDTGLALLNLVLIVAIFAFLIRTRLVPGMAWLVFGLIVMGNLLIGLLYSLFRYGSIGLYPGSMQFFTDAGTGVLYGLMLIAVGALAARRYGVMALLFIIGGYSLVCLDSDYLFLHPYREWAGLPVYFAGLTLLFLAVTPIGLMRAKTRMGRIAAVFAPVIGFNLIRLVTPLLVIQQPVSLSSGDVILAINMVISFVLAWVLYRDLGQGEKQGVARGVMGTSTA